MDLNQLKSFVAVAHQGNLTQAAESLHLSQPAVSAQIKAIETHLDIRLFERNAQGMSLTRAGRALLPEAEAMLRHMHRLDHFASTLSGNHRETLEIGIIHPLSSKKTALLAKRLNERLPHVHFAFRFGLSGDISNAVRKKELHAGFFLGENPYRNLCAVALEAVDYVLVCHRDDHAALMADMPKSLKQRTWIDMSSASGSSKHIRRLWREIKATPSSRISCDRPSAMIDMAAQGLGLAFVPRNSALKACKHGLPLAVVENFSAAIDLHFIYHTEFEEHPLLAELHTLVKQVWTDTAVPTDTLSPKCPPTAESRPHGTTQK